MKTFRIITFVHTDYGNDIDNQPVRDSIHTIIHGLISVGWTQGMDILQNAANQEAYGVLTVGKDKIVALYRLKNKEKIPTPLGIWGDQIGRFIDSLQIEVLEVFHDGIHPHEFCQRYGIDPASYNLKPNFTSHSVWTSDIEIEPPTEPLYFDAENFLPDFQHNRKVDFGPNVLASQRERNYYTEMARRIDRYFPDGNIIRSQLWKKLNADNIHGCSGRVHRWSYKSAGALLSKLVENNLVYEESVHHTQLTLFGNVQEYKNRIWT